MPNGRLPGGEWVNIVIPPACEKAWRKTRTICRVWSYVCQYLVRLAHQT
jgi:hypothetical protein